MALQIGDQLLHLADFSDLRLDDSIRQLAHASEQVILAVLGRRCAQLSSADPKDIPSAGVRPLFQRHCRA
jgi:hypothetical protein